MCFSFYSIMTIQYAELYMVTYLLYKSVYFRSCVVTLAGQYVVSEDIAKSRVLIYCAVAFTHYNLLMFSESININIMIYIYI